MSSSPGSGRTTRSAVRARMARIASASASMATPSTEATPAFLACASKRLMAARASALSRSYSFFMSVAALWRGRRRSGTASGGMIARPSRWAPSAPARRIAASMLPAAAGCSSMGTRIEP